MTGGLAGWYQVGWSDEVTTGLGPTFTDGSTDGVVVRTAQGAVGAIGRWCRHRSVDLAATATVTDQGVRCRFHGWQTSVGGVVLPCEDLGGSALTLRAPVWSTVEAHGGVWVWLGGKTPSWDVVAALEEALPAGHRVVAERTYDVGTGIERIVENTIDPWHLKYLHGAASVPRLELATAGPLLRFGLEFDEGPPVLGGWLGPGVEYLRFGGDLDLAQVVGLFPVGPARTAYRTRITAPPGADPDAVAEAVAQQFAALDEDVVVWDATGDRVRNALTEPEREHLIELKTWFGDQRVGSTP